MLIAVKDHSVTSRTIAQHIESVTHHSVPFTAEWSVLKMSIALSTLDAEPQTLPPLMVRERRMWAAEWNEVVFTDESRICLQHHDGRIRVWRHREERMLNIYIIHRHTGPALGIFGRIGYHSRTPLVRIAFTLNSQRYISKMLEPVDGGVGARR
ncbi:transposable element Tcb1 transposase [Trichonephila clavipes]|nr:transposable element Tcb1 transposase [Trichonephila clavipes]